MAIAAGILAGVQGALSIGQTIVGWSQSSKALKEMTAAVDSMRAVALQKQQYAYSLDDQWKNLYGDVASQNAEYYSNLTADKLKQQYQMSGDAAIGQVYKSLTNTQSSIKEFMNRSNMGNSSQALSALLQADNAALQQNASIALETEFKKLGADAEVAQQKLAYQQTGETLRQNAVQMQSSAYDSLLSVENAALGVASTKYGQYTNMMNAGIQGIANTLGNYSSALLNKEAMQNAEYIKQGYDIAEYSGKYNRYNADNKLIGGNSSNDSNSSNGSNSSEGFNAPTTINTKYSQVDPSKIWGKNLAETDANAAKLGLTRVGNKFVTNEEYEKHYSNGGNR